MRWALLLLVACAEAPKPTTLERDLDPPVHRSPDEPIAAVPVAIQTTAPTVEVTHAVSLSPADDPAALVGDILAVFETGGHACGDRATRLRPLAERARGMAAVDDVTHDKLASKILAVEQALDAMVANCRRKADRDPVFEELRRAVSDVFGAY